MPNPTGLPRDTSISDLNMYYSGCYVCTPARNEKKVIYVEEVRINDRGDCLFHGNLYSQADGWGEYGSLQVLPYLKDPFLPESGYYQLFDGQFGYLEYVTEKRTTRKGLIHNRLIWNLAPARLNGRQIYDLFNPVRIEGMVSRDCVVRDSIIFWRGQKIGHIADNKMKLAQKHQFLDSLISKYLSRGGLIHA